MKKYHLKRYPHIFYYHLDGERRYGFRITEQLNGRRHDFKKQGLKDLSSAVNAFDQILSHPVKKSAHSHSKLTVSKWAQKLQSTRKMQWKPSTAKNFARICKNDLCPYIGDLSIKKITPLVYQNRVLNPLTKKGFRKSSLNTIGSVISELLNSAVQEQLISANPLKGFRLRQGRSRRKKTLMSHQQFSQFFKSLSKEPLPIRFLFSLLGLTGMRMGEALGLQWPDFSNNYASVTINATRDSNGRRPPKTPQSHRKLKLPKSLSELAKSYHNAQAKHKSSKYNQDHYVIISKKGNPLTSGDVSRYLKQCLTDAGLSSLQGRFTAHTFRHQFASYMIASGVPIAEVSRVLGHANPAITLRVYTQVVPKRQANDLGNRMLNIVQGGTKK